MSRLFSRSEIDAIIKKASAIDHVQNNEEGLSLEELKNLAKEAGISEKAIQLAVEDFQKPEISAQSSKSDTHLFEVRTIHPAADASTWSEIVDELRHTFGTSMGTIKQDDTKQEWIHNSSLGVETRASLTDRGNASRIRLSQRVGAGSRTAESFGYGSLISGFASFAVHSKLSISFFETAALFSALFVVSSALIYLADGMWRKNKQKQLSALADRLSQLVASPASSTSKTMLKNDTSSQKAVPIKRISMDEILWDEMTESKLPNRLRS